MSPYEIGILLHYYCRADDHEDIRREPPIWEPTINGFIANQLLTTGTDTTWAITDRGRAYVDALQRVPLPIQVWIIP